MTEKINNKKTLLPPHDYLSKLSRSSEFLEALSASESQSAAFGKCALTLVSGLRERHQDFLDIDGQAINIIATLPGFIEGQRNLDRLRQNHAPAVQYEAHKRKVISFNHAIEECIDMNPQLTPNQILEFATETTLRMSKSPEDAKFVNSNLRGVLVGMQQELLVESALWRRDDVDDIQRAGVEDELRGVDRIVVMNDGRRIYLDVKSSFEGEKDALGYDSSNGSEPFWSGVDSHELSDSFKPTDNQIGVVNDRIDRVFGEKMAA